jgi:hypothetical protein
MISMRNSVYIFGICLVLLALNARADQPDIQSDQTQSLAEVDLAWYPGTWAKPDYSKTPLLAEYWTQKIAFLRIETNSIRLKLTKPTKWSETGHNSSTYRSEDGKLTVIISFHQTKTNCDEPGMEGRCCFREYSGVLTKMEGKKTTRVRVIAGSG